MSPNLTEMVYALGEGARLVGDTDFCNFPPEARDVARIGGYYDSNYEMICRLQPDLVLVSPEHDDARARLDALGIPHATFDTTGISNILATVRQMGRLLEAEDRAEGLAGQMEREMESIRARVAGAPPRRALVSVGRNMGDGTISDIFVAGPGTLFNELLEAAGGTNVYDGAIPYATVLREGLLRMNPEVIFDLIPDLERQASLTREQVLADWNGVGDLEAARQGRVVVLGGDYVCIPGPRIALILRDLARALHPERFEEVP